MRALRSPFVMAPTANAALCIDLAASTRRALAAARGLDLPAPTRRMTATHLQALCRRLAAAAPLPIAALADSPDFQPPDGVLALQPSDGRPCHRWLAAARTLGADCLVICGCDAPLVTPEGLLLILGAAAAAPGAVVAPAGLPLGSAPLAIGRAALERLARGQPPAQVSQAGRKTTDRTCLLGEWLDITLGSPFGRQLAQEFIEGPQPRRFSLWSLAGSLLAQPRLLLEQMIPHLPRRSRAALQPQARRGPVVIAGYYGYGNLGDEAILEAIIRQLRALGISDITALSGDPQRTAREHGVNSAPILALDEVAGLLARARAFVLGGGGMIQNAFNVDTRDLLQQFTDPQGGLMHLLLLALLAKAMGCRVMAWSVGIDPVFRQELAADAAHLLLGLCDKVTVRDRQSLSFCEGWRDVRGKALLSADASISHPAASFVPPSLGAREKKALVVPRAWYTQATHPVAGPIRRDTAAAWARACDRIAERGYALTFAVLQKGESGLDDGEIARRIIAQMDEHSGAQVVQPRSWEELLGEAARCRAAVCMRLHGAIAAALAATPLIGVAYDPKVRVFMESVGMGDFVLDLAQFEASGGEALLDLWARLEGDAERISSALATAARGLREAAGVAGEVARGVLGGGSG